ncbi:hypothetical protein ABT116_48615, partial [Streptomyces sp. NPDC002130]|uniref:hypothetical protein n=1 Tax=Streptomyces sp. NPDC002130 TaxID=3155568 RepID=UPI00331A0280
LAHRDDLRLTGEHPAQIGVHIRRPLENYSIWWILPGVDWTVPLQSMTPRSVYSRTTRTTAPSIQSE